MKRINWSHVFIAVDAAIITLLAVAAFESSHVDLSAIQTQPKQSVIDSDYCAGIACTEETDTCCDWNVQ